MKLIDTSSAVDDIICEQESKLTRLRDDLAECREDAGEIAQQSQEQDQVIARLKRLLAAAWSEVAQTSEELKHRSGSGSQRTSY